MKILIDSHVFVWALLDSGQLSKNAANILTSREHELSFSLASLWELNLKIRSGKLNALTSSIAYLRDELDSFGISILPVSFEDLLASERLDMHHKDPFDRMLIAQAIRHRLVLLTCDAAIQKYPVKTIW